MKKTVFGFLQVSLFVLEINFSFAQVNADFTSDKTTGCGTLQVNFINNSTGTGTLTYLWNFGDGTTSTQQNPGKTYLTPGTYTVSLTVSNGTNSDTETKTNYITVFALPVVNFSQTDTSGCAPFQVNFTDQSSSAVSFSSWLWTFGDGNTSTQQNPQHIYTQTGIYSVSLFVTDANNCSGSKTKTSLITVFDSIAAKFNMSSSFSCIAPFTVNFTSDTNNVYPSTAIVFTGSSDSPMPIILWEWNFGDGDSLVSTADIPQKHKYKKPGEYFVTLKVTDKDSCTAFTQYKITIIEGVELSNIFTPNGDGKNDFFFIPNGGMAEHHIVIFNRWGEKIYENRAKEIQWYGKNFAGAEVPEGTYYFILESAREDGEVIINKNYIVLSK